MEHRRTVLRNGPPKTGALRKIESWNQLPLGGRGQSTVWLPSTKEEIILNLTSNTTGLGPTLVKPSVVAVPPNAVGFMVILAINANTVTAGNVNAMLLRDIQGTAIGDAAVRLSGFMGSANASYAVSSHCPIVAGGVYYLTTVTGTVNYDLVIRVVGFVLE